MVHVGNAAFPIPLSKQHHVTIMSRRTFILLIVTCSLWLSATAAWAKSDAVNKAKDAASHSDWEQVVQFAGQATKEDPGNEEAWTLLGQGQMAMGDTASAIAALEQAVKIEPRTPAAVLDLTSYYLKKNDQAAAERVVAAAEERDSKGKYEEIKVARGLIFAKQGDMAKATQILTSATVKDPKNPLYPQILARIYADKKVTDLAEKYYADAWKLSPGNVSVAYEYGLVLLDKKKYDEALNLFKTVQQKDPKNKSVDYLIGRLYYAANRFGDASQQFEGAVQKRPDHFLSWLLLGKSYLEYSRAEKVNSYPKAEAALRKALELRPDNPDAKKSLGEAIFTEARIYYQRGLVDSSGNARALYDSSITFAHEALKYDTTQAGVYGQIARAFFKEGNLDSTIAYSKLQLVQTPDDEGEFARLINSLQKKKDYAGLAEVLQPVYGKQDWTQTKSAADSTKKPQDRFIERYGGVYSYALMESGKAAQAKDALKQMLAYNPGWCDGYGQLAGLDMQRQNFAGAIPTLQAAVRSCPKDGDLWDSLGQAYYFSTKKPTKGDLEKAKEAWTRACALGNKDACDKLNQLKGAGQ
jgi:cytochrome c-type biogenesis protein CcmH/NrfG